MLLQLRLLLRLLKSHFRKNCCSIVAVVGVLAVVAAVVSEVVVPVVAETAVVELCCYVP